MRNPFLPDPPDGQMPEMEGFTLAERKSHESLVNDATNQYADIDGHLGEAARCLLAAPTDWGEGPDVM